MAKFEIKRWDSVLVEGNQHPYPMIYIKPSAEFLERFKKNSYDVLVRVEGSGRVYDGHPTVGTVGSMECDRPNLFKETGLYTVTLYAGWEGYPPQLGSAHVTIPDGVEVEPCELDIRDPFQNSKECKDTFHPIDVSEPEEPEEPETCAAEPLRVGQLTGVGLGVATFLAVLYAVSKPGRKA